MTASALGRAAIFVACLLWLGWHALLVGVMADRLNMNDFGKIYFSMAAFLGGQDMYAPSPATLIPLQTVRSGVTVYHQFWNLNPPHFHLPLLPLALLPPLAALAIWGGASVLALALSLRLAGREAGITLTPTGRRLATLGVLAFAGMGAVTVTGQMSFLLLLPVTLAWMAARRGRWTAAGIVLGATMSVKPFLGIFLPYLLLRRQLRSAVAACVTAALGFAAGLAVFGVERHRMWLKALGEVDWAWVSMNASARGFLERTLDTSLYFTPLLQAPGAIRPLWLLLVAVLGGVTLAVAARDRTPDAADRAFALVLLGALLVSPLGWLYYLWLPLGPLLLLAARRWRERAASSGGETGPAARWRTGLALAALPGLFVPVPAATVFQPAAWATLFPGSAYFLATLFLWGALLADWRARSAESPARPPLVPVTERRREAARRGAR